MITAQEKARIDLILTTAAAGKQRLNTTPTPNPYFQAIREAMKKFDQIWSEASV